MAWIDTIDPELATGPLKKLFDQISSARGGIANVHRITSLNLRAMQAHLDIYKAIVFQRSSLSRLMRERIAVAVSRVNRCDYCVAHHSEALRGLGDDPVIVDALATGELAPVLSDADRALLVWTEKIARDPAATSQADVDQLVSLGFDDRAILDASLTASYFCFVNRVVMSLGVAVEDDYAATCSPVMDADSGQELG